MRAAARMLAVLAAVAALVAVGAGPADAHAYLVRTDPADGSVLDSAPAALTLDFSESVELGSTSIDVTDGAGHHLRPTSLRLRRSTSDGAGAEAGTEQPVELVVGLPALAADVYRLSWRTLSSDDLHVTTGVLVFGVQRKATAAGPAPEPRPRPAEAALRWLVLLGAGGLLGGLLLAGLGRRRGVGAASVAALARAAAGAGIAAAVLGVGLLLVQGGGGPVRVLGGTAYGPRWAVREVALVVLVVLALRLRRGRGGRAALALGSAAAASVGLSSALLGHAGATAAAHPGRVLLDAAHLLSVLGWAGGVLVAGVVLVPRLRRPDDRAATLTVLRTFSSFAAGGAAAAALTGVALAGSTVASLDALLLSLYGRILLAKLVVVAIAALLALRTAVRVRGRGGDTGRALRLEAAGLAVVLAAAAVLTSAQPALGPRWSQAGARVEPLVSGQADDLVETVAVQPNRPGRNVVAVAVLDSRRPAPAPVTGVSVAFVSPDGATRVIRPALRSADGGWIVTLDDLAGPGRWHVTVTALRPGLPAATADYDWVVADPGARPPVVSAAPLAPVLDLAALGGLLLVLLGIGVAVLRRRRPGWPRPAAGPPTPDLVPDLAEASGELLVGGGR